MQDLIRQEQFELEVLEKLHSRKLLSGLAFTGGTMLRLCFGLNRYSVDLDFWTVDAVDFRARHAKIEKTLAETYQIKDAALKKFTLLFELKSGGYPRSLKLEIRREKKKIVTESAIAWSPHSHKQVLLNVVSLPEMMQAKIAAFQDRREIRDVFDIEFMLKRGIRLPEDPDLLTRVLEGISRFKKTDYTNKLGSLLEEKERKYYLTENFKILKLAIAGQRKG